MGDGARITVNGSCGWSVGENLMSGSIDVHGNGGSSAGATLRGGRVFVAGTTGARTGISMKGGTLVVGGSVGYMSGFMMQRGTMIVCGDAADGIGDSMYEGTVYVGGSIHSLGADCIEAEVTDDDGACSQPSSSRMESRRPASTGRSSSPARSSGTSRSTSTTHGGGRCERRHSARLATATCSSRSGCGRPRRSRTSSPRPSSAATRNRGLGMTKRPPHFEDLTFVPCTLTRIPLEGYRETLRDGDRDRRPPRRRSRSSSPRPITIAGMSYGALSRNAKQALGMAATRVGISTTTGDGGMLDLEREALRPAGLPGAARAGTASTPTTCGMANAIEIVVGQGAKPGTGGVLLGAKVSPMIAEVRELPPGVDQRSPVRHPDFSGPTTC